MSLQTVHLTVPTNKLLPDLSVFSPEENYLMLKIGSDCLLEGRRVVVGLTQCELYEKVQVEKEEEFKELELGIIVEREMTKRMEERYVKMYETQISQMRQKIEIMDKQLKSYECENAEIINNEVEKIRDKCNVIIDEKEKQNQLNRDVFDKALKVSQVSITVKGVSGELRFSDLAETFKDHNKFYLEDKHTQSGQGDFHLHFDEFVVLADAKNYSNKVDKTQRDKIKKDLLKNEHISFGWLVSLNTNIDKYDKDPIMFEWVNTRQCIVYINNLLSYECPEKFLRVAYLVSTQLYNLIKSQDTDELELSTLRETNYKIIGKIKNMKTSIREINTGINIMKKQVDNLSNEIVEIIDLESKGLVNTCFAVLDDWWEKNIEVTDDECVLSSSEIWLKFRQGNKELIKELEVTPENLKEYIKTKVPTECRKLKSSKKGAIEIINMKLVS
tara:strand:- start:33 stop:1364 length:1332 start_codon:yes stop_codon:yes gene_type:complete